MSESLIQNHFYIYCYKEESADLELELGGECWPIGTMLV